MNEQGVNYKHICQSTLGQELDDSECQVLAGIMQQHSLKNGEYLVTEGDSNPTLFLLAAGKLTVISKIGNEEKNIYTMKQGECAGTRAFVDRAPRAATLKADGDAIVYSLEPDPFESLLNNHPHIVYKVMRALFRITHSNLMRMNQESEQLSNYINKTRGRY